jgi:putative redox protein
MIIKQKTLIDLKLRGVAETHARTHVTTRDVATLVDEPAIRGGSNMAPSPTETLMASLAGCTNVVSSRIAEKLGVQLLDLTVDIDAKLDRRGAALELDVAIPFPEVTVTIHANSDATPEQIAILKHDLARFCPIAQVLRQAGSKVTDVWDIRPI